MAYLSQSFWTILATPVYCEPQVAILALLYATDHILFSTLTFSLCAVLYEIPWILTSKNGQRPTVGRANRDIQTELVLEIFTR